MSLKKIFITGLPQISTYLLTYHSGKIEAILRTYILIENLPDYSRLINNLVFKYISV